ncbi:MAG: DUF3987 domain-containing protein, partial [candidate division NC10 bacterium]|nr:DUF3987 domain-containing protein [candidate division NC10 bacterium]
EACGRLRQIAEEVPSTLHLEGHLRLLAYRGTAGSGAGSSGGLPTFPEALREGLVAQWLGLFPAVTEAPDCFHWGVFLACTGLALGRRLYLAMPKRIYPNFYCLLLGRAGATRKSTALHFGIRLLEDLGQPVILVPGLGSIEGLYAVLAKEKETRVLLHPDELGSLLAVARREVTGNILPRLNTLHGMPERDALLRADPLHVERPCVALITAAPPAWLEQILQRQDLSSGFLARFLILSGEPKAPLPFPAPPPQGEWNGLLKAVHGALDGLPPEPSALTWSVGARERWGEWYRAFRAAQARRPEAVAALLERLPEHLLKAAIVYQALSGSLEIPPERVDQLGGLGSYLQAQAEHYSEVLVFGEAVRRERLILQILRREGAISYRALSRRVDHLFSTEVLNRHLDALQRAGRVRRGEARTGKRGPAGTIISLVAPEEESG